MRLGMFTQTRCPPQTSKMSFPQPKNSGVETEVQMVLPVVTGTIPIVLVVDMNVLMVPQVDMMVVFQMIHRELIQITPNPQSLKEDIDMTDKCNNMIS